MPRTQQLLSAIGDPDGFALLEVLERRAVKQTALAAEAGVAGGTASSRIEVLLALGLVQRPTARGVLTITHPEAFRAVIAAADALNGLILQAAAEEHRSRTSDESSEDG